MVKNLLSKVFGTPEEKTLKRLSARVGEINDLEKKYQDKPLKELKKLIDDYRGQVTAGKTDLDKIMPDVFAIVRETARQVLEQRHFDVQLVGGMALHEGNVTEMRTGEGKTLVATLPVVLNALEGKGVHVVTVNDYLAQRDAGWMGQIYHTLGFSVGVVIARQTYLYDPTFSNDEHDDPRFRHLRPVDSRREGYQADITYGTNNEFGFDYLRDNMVRDIANLRQRELHYAIVDEVDSILIDEARTPLIISAAASQSGSNYQRFAQIVKRLGEGDYEKDEKARSVTLTDDGVQKVQDMLGIENLYAPEYVSYIYHVEQALRAEVLFKRDKDYVATEDGEIVIVDEFTGRMMQGRRYSEGLHQAIEAKEGVEVKQESSTLATISLQNYFRLYDKLSGMTGTAETEAEEFYQIYKLGVVVIPTNKPTGRTDLNDVIYKNQTGKYKALVEKVKELQEKGQPVLIGTASIEKNELVSALLARAGVEHSVLNAKNNEGEAAVIAGAGQQRAVTLATNIAGRGTDIVLGEGVVELGGLFVLGSERHEARRIDNQLRGRAGRQGDPGTTQFFISAEDDLMRVFGGERMINLMSRLGVAEDMPIENRAISKSIETAQKRVESHNFDARKRVVQYDDVMNRHRKSIYALRKSILQTDKVDAEIKKAIDEFSARHVLTEGTKDATLAAELSDLLGLTPAAKKKLSAASGTEFASELAKALTQRLKSQSKKLGEETLKLIGREIYLQILDSLWMQHLENMDHLREGIGWRQVGQRDPLVEYRREGQRLFESMRSTLITDVLRAIMNARPIEREEAEAPVETELTRAARTALAGESKKATTKKKADKAEVKIVRRSAQDTGVESRRAVQNRRAKRKRERRNRKKNRR